MFRFVFMDFNEIINFVQTSKSNSKTRIANLRSYFRDVRIIKYFFESTNLLVFCESIFLFVSYLCSCFLIEKFFKSFINLPEDKIQRITIICE